MEQFLNALAENAADVLILAAVLGGVAGLILWVRARTRHVRRLRHQLNGVVSLPDGFKESLARALNADTAEFTAIGAVTFVDIAWHYSIADPQIWDHFQGPGAQHMVDALANIDVLKSSLGNILTYFRAVEAVQVFHDIAGPISAGSVDAVGAVLNAPGSTLVDWLGHEAAKSAYTGAAEAKAGAVTSAAGKLGEKAATTAAGVGLLAHIPVVTIAFASYRAWRRAQKGAELHRNVEFAAIEVATRAGGGLVGGQIGGAVGSVIAPGVGTLIGGIAGAVAGAIGGALLGEEFKQRHVRKAKEQFETALDELGRLYLEHPGHYRELTEVFVRQERHYSRSLRSIRLRRDLRALLPWQMIWPDQKLVLLDETVKMARARLAGIKKGTLDALDQLSYMKTRGQHRELGMILWDDPALRQELAVDPQQIDPLVQANDRLRTELIGVGAAVRSAAG